MNCWDAAGNSPLSAAAQAGSGDIVEKILTEKVDANLADGHGLTPLMWAIEKNDTETLKIFLAANGVDPNQKGELSHKCTQMQS